MKILEQLNEDYKEALKEKQTEKKNTLRLILNSIEQKRIDKGKDKELKKENVIEILNKEAQKREESIEQYQEAAREDLAEKENKELKLIKQYLPEPLSESEIKTKISKAIEELGAQGLEDMGRVMGKVMPQMKGGARGDRVKEIVKNKLS